MAIPALTPDQQQDPENGARRCATDATAVPMRDAANGIVSSVRHIPTTTARYSTPKTSSMLCFPGGEVD